MEAFEEGKVNPSADCGGEDWMVFTLGECEQCPATASSALSYQCGFI